ncbi:hypothetical protein TRFO_26229 [Tritrichomonas foetus]|uniref:IQ calmodulin-binding motif family protein n=1 Tax=Tritrichomonas foetus TaxID=1144522 RepID=A0A1J4K3W0_9EUKA|nr:hypothetical protein TRFO_26229 [Tritrichomonas foetus]|eukprot:OHT05875.1 hypothetical protein TRFO_26229 [Tritrichomonas foetus]
MRRFAYGATHTHRQNYDPNDPNSRPIGISPHIVKPKVSGRFSASRLNFNHPHKLSKESKSRSSSVTKSAEQVDNLLTTYTPPESKDYSEALNNSISHFFDIENSSQNCNNFIHIEAVNFEENKATKEENALIATNFVRSFILEKTQDVQALVIQNAFRLYMKKKRWQRRIGIHVNYNIRLKKLMFLCWRLSVSNDPEKLAQLFSKFYGFYQFIRHKFKIREMAPFRLFYISGRIFLPDGYTATVVYNFIYLMSMPLLHRIIRLWAYTARKRRQHRKTLVFIRQTSKKISLYGEIYHMFHSWYRFTKWKKLEKDQQRKEKIIKLKCSEVDPRWNVLERKLNTKRIHILRASEHSKKRICAKAIRALYNRSIETIAESQVIEISDNFRNHHLQALAHRAWLKFLQKRSHENQILRDAFRNWYALIYDQAERKFKFDMSTLQHDNMKLIKIMNSWYNITQMRKMATVEMMLKTQANPSMSLAIIFLLLNRYEMFFSTLAFRLWIRFIRSRNRWKNFARWSSQPNHDRETAHIVLTELRRVATLRLMRRLYVSAGQFIPRHVGYSFELTYREYLKQKYDDEYQAKNHHWNFMTSAQRLSLAQPKYNSEALVRCFLLRLNQIKKFDGKTADHELPLKKEGNPYFEQFRTREDLETAVAKNKSLMHLRLTVKMSRDEALLAGMVSHISAMKTAKAIPGFTTKTTFTYVKNSSYDLINENEKVIVYPDLSESIAFIQKQIKEAPPKIPYNFERMRNEAIEAFQGRLRSPRSLSNSPNKFTSVVSMFGKTLMDLGSAAAPLQIRNNITQSPGYKLSNNTKGNNSSSIFNSNSGIPRLSEPEAYKYYLFSNIRNVFEQSGTADTIMSSVQRFVMDTTGVYLETSNILTLKKPNEIYPEADQSLRHKMTRNIALFLAQMAGITNLDKVPRHVNAPPFANEMVSSILTLHSAFMKTSLSQYCDPVPFQTSLRLDDSLLLDTFHRIWSVSKKKYPKIEHPVGFLPLVKQFGQLSKSSRFSSLNSFGSTNNSLANFEELIVSSKDVYITCILLPFILSFDSVNDYAKDEIFMKIQK